MYLQPHYNMLLYSYKLIFIGQNASAHNLDICFTIDAIFFQDEIRYNFLGPSELFPYFFLHPITGVVTCTGLLEQTNGTDLEVMIIIFFMNCFRTLI